MPPQFPRGFRFGGPLPVRPLAFAALAAVLLSAPRTVRADTTPETKPAGFAPLTLESLATVAKGLAGLDASPDTVIAEAGSRIVSRGDIADRIRALPVNLTANSFQYAFDTAAVEAVRQAAMCDRAEGLGLDKRLDVRRRMDNAAETVLADAFLRLSLAPNLAETALRETYQNTVAGRPGPEEVEAKVIAVASRDDAEAVIKRLDNGESFWMLAKTLSEDATAEKGGELGYVEHNLLAPELGAVLFSLGTGHYTAHPIQLGSRWFVLQAGGRRLADTPAFDNVRPVLASEVSRAGALELRRQALASAKTEIIDQLPSSVPATPVGSPEALDRILAALDAVPAKAVARVEGQDVLWADVSDEIRALPSVNATAVFREIFDAALSQVMQRKALAARAVAAGLSRGPVVQRRIRNAREAVLAEDMLRRSVAPNLTEAAVRATWDAMMSKRTEEQVELRDIAFGSKLMAEDIARRVQAGAPPDDLVRAAGQQISPQGGDLGFVRHGELAPAIAAVAFTLGNGETAAHPVESGGVWHILQAGARRTAPALPFEAARHGVEQDIIAAARIALPAQAVKETKVVYYGMMGKSPEKPRSQ